MALPTFIEFSQQYIQKATSEPEDGKVYGAISHGDNKSSKTWFGFQNYIIKTDLTHEFLKTQSGLQYEILP